MLAQAYIFFAISFATAVPFLRAIPDFSVQVSFLDHFKPYVVDDHATIKGVDSLPDEFWLTVIFPKFNGQAFAFPSIDPWARAIIGLRMMFRLQQGKLVVHDDLRRRNYFVGVDHLSNVVLVPHEMESSHLEMQAVETDGKTYLELTEKCECPCL